jgi:hypothetical protein
MSLGDVCDNALSVEADKIVTVSRSDCKIDNK